MERDPPRHWVGRNSLPPCPRLQWQLDSDGTVRLEAIPCPLVVQPPHPRFVQHRRLTPRRWSLHRHRRPSGLPVAALWDGTLRHSTLGGGGG
jgi:hypothetical protein